MRRAFIVRHGNTFDPGDTILRVGRGTDLPLSTSGRKQAEALGRTLGKIDFDSVLCSPLKRTRQTAEAITDDFTLDDRLLEIDYGPDEGKPEEVVVARLGEDALTRWDQEAIPPRDWHVDPAALRQMWRDLLDEIDGTALIVTSNGIARFVLDVALNDGAPRKLKTGAYGIIESRGDQWVVTEWNVRPDT